jgi:hypothetical protein
MISGRFFRVLGQAGGELAATGRRLASTYGSQLNQAAALYRTDRPCSVFFRARIGSGLFAFVQNYAFLHRRHSVRREDVKFDCKQSTRRGPRELEPTLVSVRSLTVYFICRGLNSVTASIARASYPIVWWVAERYDGRESGIIINPA